MVTVDANQDDLLTKAATNLKFIFFKGTLLEKFSSFPVPSRDVTYQTLPGRELFNYSRTGSVWYVTSQLGTGKLLTFFYSVGYLNMSSRVQ
jgi:hypothetical protein